MQPMKIGQWNREVEGNTYMTNKNLIYIAWNQPYSI